MRAVLSGEAGVALIGDEQSAWRVSIEAMEQRIPCSWNEAPLVFAGAGDVEEFVDISIEEALDCLHTTWRSVRALQLFLVLLDVDEEDETKSLAIGCVERHFADPVITEYVANRLFSSPLPFAADLCKARELAAIERADNVANLLCEVDSFQPEITKVRRAWDEIPSLSFELDGNKCRFETVLISAGIYRCLSLSIRNGGIEQVWINTLYDSRVNRLRGHRRVITMWVTRLRELKEQPTDAGQQSVSKSANVQPPVKQARSPKEQSIHEKKTRVDNELIQILSDIDEGREARALKFTQELVQRQKAEGDSEYAVKTLCNLAKKSKDRGLYVLQMELAKWAVEDFPWDSRAHVQLADAYVCLGRLDEALAQYERAIQFFPDDKVAFNGRADVLRRLGRLHESLDHYDESIRRFTENPFALNGRATTLRDLGQLADALAQYDRAIELSPGEAVSYCARGEVLRKLGRIHDAIAQFDAAIHRFPDDVFGYCGRGEVLRDSGRLAEALAQYNAAVELFPNDTVPLCGRNEVLRDLGQLEEALAQYDGAIQRFPHNPVAYCGRAEVLRDLGRVEAALSQYDAAIKKFPYDVVVGCGRGEALRNLGRLEDALTQYDATIAQFSYSFAAYCGRAGVLCDLGRLEEALDQYDFALKRFPSFRRAKTGKACLLIRLKRWDEALALLGKQGLTSHDDWIDLHVHGMVYLRSGNYDAAIQIFQEGVQDCPFAASRRYFQSALAVAQIRQGQFSSAVSTLAKQSGEMADVLRLHVHGQERRIEDARAVYERLMKARQRWVADVRDLCAQIFFVEEGTPVQFEKDIVNQIFEIEYELVSLGIAA